MDIINAIDTKKIEVYLLGFWRTIMMLIKIILNKIFREISL